MRPMIDSQERLWGHGMSLPIWPAPVSSARHPHALANEYGGRVLATRLRSEPLGERAARPGNKQPSELANSMRYSADDPLGRACTGSVCKTMTRSARIGCSPINKKGRPFRTALGINQIISLDLEVVAILLVTDEAELGDRGPLHDGQRPVDDFIPGLRIRLEVKFRLGIHARRLIEILTQRHFVDR